MVRDVKERLNWKKYSWEKFEDICYEYISEKYDSAAYKVEITKRKKDGGRDIIITSHELDCTIWGECKHHKTSVGLNTIGKNVVLAITNYIHKLIFFSVSNVTPNTKHEILRAAKIHNFDVLFLDGYNLDLEISSNKMLLKKYFLESFHLYHPNDNILLADFCVDEFENAHNSDYNTDNSYTKLENGLTFYIHVFLKNYFKQDVTDISISLKETDRCHLYKTNFHITQIKSFCDMEITIKGLLLNTQEIVKLPHIEIAYIASKISHNFVIMPGEIDGTHIWRIPFCGQQNLSFMAKEIPRIEKNTQKGYVRILYIKGISGTGKSRLLEEIETKFAEKGVVSIYIDSQSHSRNLFFRELIRQLLCLPVNEQKKVFSVIEFTQLLSKCHIDFFEIQTLYDFLWKNKKIEIVWLADFIFQCIANSPLDHRLYIQIDNLQRMDTETQQCMTYLCESLRKEKIGLCIAFTFNTGVACISPWKPLVNFLETHSLHEENPFVITFQLKELEPSSANYMVQSCLKLMNTYTKETERIVQKTGRLPLDILLFCKTLYNSNCFSWSGENRIISNPELFNKQLNLMSTAELSIVELRIQNLLKSHAKTKYHKIFQLLLICENRLPLGILVNYSISLDSVRLLKENLILCENHDSTISFYHDNYFRYFIKQETVYIFNEKDWEKLQKSMLKYEMILGSVAQVNNIKCLAYLGKKNEFFLYSKKQLDKFCAEGNSQAVLNLTYFSLKWLLKWGNMKQWVLFSIEKGSVELESISFNQGIATLHEIKNILDDESSYFDKEMIGEFYHQYVNAFTHSAKYREALTALDDYAKIDGLAQIYYFLIEDRRSLAYNSLGNFEKAQEHINNALQIADKMKDDFWTSTAYSDKAFNYVTNTNDKTKIIAYFDLAVQCYPSDRDTTQYRLIEIEIQACLSNLLCQKYKEAEEHINLAIKYSKERAYTYLSIPANNVKAYLMLIKGKPDKAFKLLYQARFDSEVFGARKYLITIFNTLGIANCLVGNNAEGGNCFAYAEEMLRELGPVENTSNRFTPLIINWLNTEYYLRPDCVIAIKTIYHRYHSKRIDCFYEELCKKGHPSENIPEQFPFVIQNYIFMY